MAIVLIWQYVGMNNVILKEIAIASERKDWQHVANTIYTALRIKCTLALSFSLLVYFSYSLALRKFFHELALKIHLIIALAELYPRCYPVFLPQELTGSEKYGKVIW